MNASTLLDLVSQYDAPLYVYDQQMITQQYQRFVDSFSVEKLKVNYACKALSNVNIIKHLHNLGAGVDAVSIQEVQLALLAGVAPTDIIYTPNGVSFEEIGEAVKLGVHINIDNLNVLEEFGQHYPSYPIGIRINPHIMAGGHSKISVGHIDSKFGISYHQVPHILRLVDTLNLTINGIHMHTGSDIMDSNVFLQGAEILFNIVEQIKTIEYVDFGSGFKVAYRPEDASTDIEDFGDVLSKRFNSFCKNIGRSLTLMFEPGKYMVSEAGYFLARVNVVKQTTSCVFAGLDTGFNHFIRPMFYDAYHGIENISNPNGKKRIYTVVGYICETDSFAWNRPIGEVKEGDVLCFKNAGAYCFSMASNYNSRFRPAEVLWDGDKGKLIRRRETIEDLLAAQIIS